APGTLVSNRRLQRTIALSRVTQELPSILSTNPRSTREKQELDAKIRLLTGKRLMATGVYYKGGHGEFLFKKGIEGKRRFRASHGTVATLTLALKEKLLRKRPSKNTEIEEFTKEINGHSVKGFIEGIDGYLLDMQEWGDINEEQKRHEETQRVMQTKSEELEQAILVIQRQEERIPGGRIQCHKEQKKEPTLTEENFVERLINVEKWQDSQERESHPLDEATTFYSFK
ncbi:31475_t:CDS:2, partial [Racocetra persica]